MVYVTILSGMSSKRIQTHLRDEDLPQLCDLVVVCAAFLPTLVLLCFEAIEEMLMEGEEGVHSGEEPLQSGLLDQVRLPQLVHVDMEEDF